MVSTISEYKVKRKQYTDYLGGKCVKCGSEKNLQFDHIIHEEKSFNISTNWSISWERIQPELDKCQLLCKSCHLEKSKNDGGLAKGWTNQVRPLEHGTINGYTRHKCRCVECKKAKTEYNRRYRNKKIK